MKDFEWDCTSVYFNLQWLSWTSMNICQPVSFSTLTTEEEPKSLKCIWNKTCIYFPSNKSGCKTQTIPRLWTSIHTFVIMMHNSLFANNNAMIWSLTWSMNQKSVCLFALSLRFSNYIVVRLIKSTNYLFLSGIFLYIQALIGRWCKRNGKHKTSLLAVKQKFFLDCTMLTSKMTWFIRSSRVALMTFILLSGKKRRRKRI